MVSDMRLVFWASLTGIGYTYFGYALLLVLMSRAFRNRPTFANLAVPPAVSIISAAHNEENRLAAKLANLSALEYPPDRLEMIVVSDGSSDETAEILSEYVSVDCRLTPVILEVSEGKANALNEAVHRAKGDILVFVDVRQSVDLDAVAELVSCFADPTIGAVSGELMIEATDGEASSGGLGIYWRMEKALRKLESQTGSVVGVTGAIYAIRRELYVDLPQGTILDDVLIPMNVARKGKRILFHQASIARDKFFSEPGKEFSRKVRTLTGNYQLLTLAPWLLSLGNPLLFRFLSHKVLRLTIPFLLALLFWASASIQGNFYGACFLAQVVVYALAICGWLVPNLRRWRIIGVAWTFTSLNVAAIVAFCNFLRRNSNVWI